MYTKENKSKKKKNLDNSSHQANEKEQSSGDWKKAANDMRGKFSKNRNLGKKRFPWGKIDEMYWYQTL